MEKLTKKEAVRLHREMWKIISEMSDKEIKECNQSPTNIELLALRKMGYNINCYPSSNSFCCEYAVCNTEHGKIFCDVCPIKWKKGHCFKEGEYALFCTEIQTGLYKHARKTAKLISKLPERDDLEKFTIKISDSVCKTGIDYKLKNGVVTIIGSINQSSGPIQDAAKLFENLGFVVYDPVNNNENKDDTLYDVQCRYIKYIEEADFVVLVRKPDGSVGECTSYELAFSNYLGKPILEWETFFNG